MLASHHNTHLRKTERLAYHKCSLPAGFLVFMAQNMNMNICDVMASTLLESLHRRRSLQQNGSNAEILGKEKQMPADQTGYGSPRGENETRKIFPPQNTLSRLSFLSIQRSQYLRLAS
jgi:hypothetical protein